ncbi:hypothetical protein ARALYDRAFT_891159 [Arabidopsis lyrata subsp. lyrata]|uniref:Phytocyanin domain-containing protein n=1 Tax=Arabidopsis lyrata subsp. lyrata TaxID=81972 RepID=D7KL52_ARALL|nr:hypothetical protein ARALYDRAFT_891159 [Arabidopsis lyrata subsp. lyrata]
MTFIFWDPSHHPSTPMPSDVLSNENVFKVGDSNGWTTKADPMWYENKHFRVGDCLLFQYN